MGEAALAAPNEAPQEAAFAALQCWLSPAFPVGAFAYSHGIEWAVEAGDIRDEASLAAWLDDLLAEGIGRSDAILIGCAHRAAMADDAAALDAVSDFALALAPSSELRLETAQQGRSFLDVAAATWPHPALAAAAGRLDAVALPVALGLAAAAHGVPSGMAIRAALTALAGNLISAAIRIAPIGQTAGQRILARLVPRLLDLAREAEPLGLDDILSGTFRADLGALRHETQYTRLFRS